MRFAPSICPAGGWCMRGGRRSGFQLEAAGKMRSPMLAPIDAQAGATVVPLSYMPGSTIPADVLLDGRILFEAGFPLGSGSTPEMYLVYSDGSGVESYRCDHGQRAVGREAVGVGRCGVHARQHRWRGLLRRLLTRRPLLRRAREYAGAIAETATGAWLVSARTGAGTHYALKMWEPGFANRLRC